MPDGRVLAALAIAMMLYVAAVDVVHGVERAAHKVKAGVARLVHPHRHAPPAHSVKET